MARRSVELLEVRQHLERRTKRAAGGLEMIVGHGRTDFEELGEPDLHSAEDSPLEACPCSLLVEAAVEEDDLMSGPIDNLLGNLKNGHRKRRRSNGAELACNGTGRTELWEMLRRRHDTHLWAERLCPARS